MKANFEPKSTQKHFVFFGDQTFDYLKSLLKICLIFPSVVSRSIAGSTSSQGFLCSVVILILGLDSKPSSNINVRLMHKRYSILANRTIDTTN